MGAKGDCHRELNVALQDMKFSAAHFVAFKGFREPLHGHNYTLGVRLGGSIQADGYVVDFGDIKKAARGICKRLNHKTLLPTRSTALQLRHVGAGPLEQVEIVCEGEERFTIPRQDCCLVPVEHTTAEELAEFIWHELVNFPSLRTVLRSRGVEWLEVTVEERPGQGASFRKSMPAAGEVVQFPTLQPSATGSRQPKPCAAASPALDEEVDEALELETTSIRNCVAVPHTHAVSRSPPAPAVYSGTSPPGSKAAEAAYKQILNSLGPSEATRPELQRTPYRAAKAFRELTSGYHVEDPIAAVGQGIFEVKGAQDLVAVRDIPFHSLCEHHLLPFSGVAHVAYLPQGRVLGLSKFARLLQVFARRLQLQERLTQHYAEALTELLNPKALAVALEARHSCMSIRGVQVPATTRTLALRGSRKDEPELRELVFNGVAIGGQSAKL